MKPFTSELDRVVLHRPGRRYRMGQHGVGLLEGTGDAHGGVPCRFCSSKKRLSRRLGRCGTRAVRRIAAKYLCQPGSEWIMGRKRNGRRSLSIGWRDTLRQHIDEDLGACSRDGHALLFTRNLAPLKKFRGPLAVAAFANKTLFAKIVRRAVFAIAAGVEARGFINDKSSGFVRNRAYRGGPPRANGSRCHGGDGLVLGAQTAAAKRRTTSPAVSTRVILPMPLPACQ